jgi:hypothetical protein
VPILTGLAVFMIVLGQFYPRLRRNPLVGCRTTFTLSSDENWARTHRFGGFTMTLGGFAMIPLARTFAFDILHCERCGGRARVIAAITERAVIDKILSHLRAASGNPGFARAPPVLPQRQATLF